MTGEHGEGIESDAAAEHGLTPPPVLTELLAAIQALHAATELRDGLEEVAEALHRYVAYDNLGVLLLDPRGRELRFALARGYSPEVEQHWRFGLGQGLVGIAAQSGEAILVEDVRLDPRYISASEPTRAELALPLKVKDRVIGVLDLGALEPGVFGPDQLALLEPVAGQLAAAIDGARLTQNLRQQTQTLSLLHELSREFTSILDRKKLLERVADRIRRLIDYDVFTVMMWNEESRLLEPQVSVYGDGPRIGTALPTELGEGISGTAAALRQTLRIPNVQLDPRYIDCVRDRTMRSELAVPMHVKDRLVGVLDLESASYDAFTPQHEHAVSTLAASLAIALENARLYGRLQEDEQRLATDLSTAREIQKQLLPKTTPWLPGLQVAFAYRPANHLGGDFYDIRPYGEGRVAIAAGDVSGKSTSAALYGSLAIGMLRQYPEDGLRPEALLRDMNYKLLELGIDNRFLALALAFYDAGDRTLVLANSGLPHPYLVRGDEVRPILVAGVPLGLLPDRHYEEELVALETGDVVVIATDGIDESHNRDDEEFGAEGVRQTLQRLAGGSARAIADGLLAASRDWAGSAEPWDDSTVVVLKAV
jgi:sigma-B regulation protein RsbU (phosphoserine phosphatase)